MNIKEQIIQEIEHLPEPLLAEALEFVRALQVKPQAKAPTKAVQAFLDSLEERKEVYQRLADS
jgi:hypothetical protein